MYQYTDATVNKGTNYYRFKQINKNGGYKYFAVMSIDYHSFNLIGKWLSWQQVAASAVDKNASVAVDVITINSFILQTINKGVLSTRSYFIPLSNQAVKGVYIYQS